MKIAILQPTYLPWIGYFGMIDLSNIFIFYDDVQFVKKQSWQRRNRIKTPHGWTWLTIPVNCQFKNSINEVRINNELNWQEKHIKSIEANYRNAPYFDEFEGILRKIYLKTYDYLAELTTKIIVEIANFLNIGTIFKFSSNIKAFGAKTDRLISILNQFKGNASIEYLTGPGTIDYLEPEKFEENEIKLFWYYFSHPKYPQQFGDFVEYMSIIDLIFNVGSKKALDIIREGNENALREKPL